ncbi:hypothetical protein [Bosea sp. OK403]|uniref:hypothetical protein n=1 Tax=Bosea sp. OK403 TaxID=1855286 RepID=UPI001113B440|nr:hypothetical protein [Bosea sp. OK403]
MIIRAAKIFLTLGSELIAMPIFLGPFMLVPSWVSYTLYVIGALLIGCYYLIRKNFSEVRLKEIRIQDEIKAFYGLYPWRAAGTGILIAFGIFVVISDDYIDWTAAQAFSIGISLWAVPHLIGEIFFGGRRMPPA